MSETKNYQADAQAIAERLGLRVTAKLAEPQTCPKWGRSADSRSRSSCQLGCGETHGNKYRVTLFFPRTVHVQDGKSIETPKRWPLSFDYWGSLVDKDLGKEPTTYDVLACVSSDLSGPTDPDEVVEEYGLMPPSQAIAVAKFAQRLQAFFTDEERDALAEVS